MVGVWLDRAAEPVWEDSARLFRADQLWLTPDLVRGGDHL